MNLTKIEALNDIEFDDIDRDFESELIKIFNSKKLIIENYDLNCSNAIFLSKCHIKKNNKISPNKIINYLN
jgi:hypothetical protein